MASTEESSSYRIGDLVRITGKTPRTLHFYEELGLLRPIARTKGGFRLYGDGALLRIKWIERLQELGFSLPEIQEFLARLHEEVNAPNAMGMLSSFYQDKLSETRATLRRLQDLERDLQESLDYLSGCRSCDPLTHRAACTGCEVGGHDPRKAPDMVAAVQDPL